MYCTIGRTPSFVCFYYQIAQIPKLLMASSSQPSARLNKSDRAKLAKDTINNVIPRILKSSTRAQAGINNTKLIHYSVDPEATRPPQQAAEASSISVAPESPSIAEPTSSLSVPK